MSSKETDDLFNQFFGTDKKEEKKPESKYHGEDCESCGNFGPQTNCYENNHSGCTGYKALPPKLLKTTPDVLMQTASDKAPDLTKDVAAVPHKTPEQPKADSGFDFDFSTSAEKTGDQKATATSEPSPFTSDVTPPPASPPPTPIQTSTPLTEGFDYSDAPKNKLMILTVYGLKGPGKTYSSFCLDGTILCISFDRKSETIHIEEFNSDSRITVKDALRYLDKTSPSAFTASSEKTFKYLVGKEDPEIGILEKYKLEGKKFDWVMLDCTEEMNRICEMVMRYRNGLMPSQGVANRNLWKDRRLYINAIHNASVDIANKGLIYTTYTDEQKIIKDGEIVALETVPKWIDVQMLETDVVIHVFVEQSFKTNERKFMGVVESSKYKLFPTGKRADITGKGLKALMEEKKN